MNNKTANKITSINFENGNGMWVRYTTLTPDTLYWKHSVDPDLLLFPQTDKTGKFLGDCIVRWKDIARIIEVDKENKGETK